MVSEIHERIQIGLGRPGQIAAPCPALEALDGSRDVLEFRAGALMHAFAAKVYMCRGVKPLVRELTVVRSTFQISLRDLLRGLKVCTASGPLCKAIQAPATAVVVERSIAVDMAVHGELFSFIFSKGANGTGLDARVTAEFRLAELLRGHQLSGLQGGLGDHRDEALAGTISRG